MAQNRIGGVTYVRNVLARLFLGCIFEAGLTPLQSLQTATINPAQFLGINDMGIIAPGMKANLVLLTPIL
jgi:adenine deaminase